MDINNVNNAQRNPYVFISYSTKNQTVADSMRNMFIEDGVENWMAPYDIPAGFKYAHVIDEALKNCECVLLLLTNDSQNSEFVEREIERAVTYKKSIITMKLEDVELNPGFRYFLSTTQVVAVREIDKSNNEMKKILDAIYAYVKPQKRSGEKRSDKSGLTLKEQVTLFLPGITKKDFDEAKTYVAEHPDEVIAGGVFRIFPVAFAIEDFTEAELEIGKNELKAWKILYRIAYIMGFEKICKGIQSITQDEYADASEAIEGLDYFLTWGRISREMESMMPFEKLKQDANCFEMLFLKALSMIIRLFGGEN